MKVYVDLAIELLRNLAVVVVVTYLVTRTRLFNAVLAGNPRLLDKLLLIHHLQPCERTEAADGRCH